MQIKQNETLGTKNDNISLKKPSSFVSKSPVLYIFLFTMWSVLLVFLWKSFIFNIRYVPLNIRANPSSTLLFWARFLLFINGIFISYFWLNGVKDFIYVIWFFVAKKALFAHYKVLEKVDIKGANDKVLLVYCTCNDFDGGSLEKSLNQTYKNTRAVILDDSNDKKYQKEIDTFAKSHNIKVVRRKNRQGFKAGNINNYLLGRECQKDGSYDYCVILDSDEIIPSNFVEEALKYFYLDARIGIVQANHVSTRNRNFFMKLFHIGVNSHWITYQTMKNFYGFSTMLGHGAMIKKECIDVCSGFPNLVAEDLCLSIEARNRDYFVVFAPNIICEEEYPIDYVAFKKRHSKWTQGNLEFIKNYTGKIIKSPMTFFEKWDIVLFTYNLPLTAIFGFYIFVNLLIMPRLNIDLGLVYKLWMTIPTIIFFFSPMLNDVFTWLFRLNIFRFLLYFVMVIVLYGSMLTTSLISATLGIFGKKAKFIVTPKESQKIGLFFALRFQIKEIIFSTILLLIAIFVPKSVLPVILIISTGYASVLLLFFSNKTYTKEQSFQIDRQTKKFTISQNPTFAYKNFEYAKVTYKNSQT